MLTINEPATDTTALAWKLQGHGLAMWPSIALANAIAEADTMTPAAVWAKFAQLCCTRYQRIDGAFGDLTLKQVRKLLEALGLVAPRA